MRRRRWLCLTKLCIAQRAAARRHVPLLLRVGPQRGGNSRRRRAQVRFQHVTDRRRTRARLLIGVLFRPWPSRWVNSGVGMMARRPPNDGASWSARELQTLRALAKAGTPTGQVAKKLGRTAAAVQQKAMRAGISFRAAKRAGARRKK